MEQSQTGNNPAGAQSRAGEAGANLSVGLAVMIEQMELEAYEKWFAGESISNPDLYKWGALWMCWQARAALQRPCRGIAHHGCNYLAPCGSICNKCGQAT